MLSGNLALTVAAVFFGAAFYVNFAEQPARLELDDHALLAESKPAYKRGIAMHAPLAILGFVLGVAARWPSGRFAFLSRRDSDDRELALDLGRRHAGQSRADGDRTRERESRDPRLDPEMELAARSPDAIGRRLAVLAFLLALA